MSTVDGIVAGQGTEQAESSWAECGRVVYILAHSKGPDPAVCTSVSHQVAVAVVVEIDQEHFSPTPARHSTLLSSGGFKGGRGAASESHDPSGSQREMRSGTSSQNYYARGVPAPTKPVTTTGAPQ